MRPTLPKKVEYISGVLESWLTEVRFMEAHVADYQMPQGFIIVALKMIMSIREDQFEAILRNHEDLINEKEEYLKRIVSSIREFANAKRLEAKARRLKEMPTPMDIGQMGKDSSHRGSEGHHIKEEDSDDSWKDYWSCQEDWDQDQGDIFAMAKGKAIGKGFEGKGRGKRKKQ